MKGVVFTEFLEMVEGSWSLDMVDQIIADSKVPSGGAYTAVGTYPPAEMVALVSALSTATQTPLPALLEAFGRHLFARFVTLYPDFFDGCSSTFEFLPRVGDYIHTEVRKLYPDAELPTIRSERIDQDTMAVSYQSPRCMAKLARGLIDGCIAHYKESFSITERDSSEGSGRRVDFTLRRAAA